MTGAGGGGGSNAAASPHQPLASGSASGSSLPPRLAGGTIPALDGFRAIAIIFVMLSHIGMERMVPGQFGVTLFFFLSGYLITTLLRREFMRDGTIKLKAFYLRRMVRIIPPMYLAIALGAVCSWAGLIYELDFTGLGYDLLFLTNYFPVSGTPIGLWSLAVEEHFYLLFPTAALLLLRRWDAKGVMQFCIVFCFLALLVRFYEVSRLEDFSRVNFWSHTRLDSILFGAILAMWNNPVIDPEDRLPSTWPSYAIGGLLLLITFVIRDEMFRQTIRYTIQGVALIFIFNAAIRDTKLAPVFLDNAFMRFVALLSYMLYLVHVIFIIAVRPLEPVLGEVGAGLVGIALSFVFSYATYVLLETPLGQWRKGVERSWREKDKAAAAAKAV
jgi:peptidoglycan/LPS O-acetylase OafA/YrhL